MPRTYTLTYDTVTPESAEHGDYADTGYGTGRDDGTTTSTRDIDPRTNPDEWRAAVERATVTVEPLDSDELGWRRLPGESEEEAQSRVACEDVAAIIREHYGATEHSSSRFDPGGWYTHPDGHQDYRTGAWTRVSVHLDGWTEDELRAVYAAVTVRRW